MSRRLKAYLVKRGVAPHAAEDLVQDVAVKVISRQLPFETVDDLMRWCVPVARNLSVDAYRRARDVATEDVGASLPASDSDDVLDRVLVIGRLRSALASIRQLPERDQAALFATVEGTEDGEPLTGAVRVRACRARARLAEMIAGLVPAVLLARVIRALRPRLATAPVLGAALVSAAFLTSSAAPGAAGQLADEQVQSARSVHVVAPTPRAVRASRPAARATIPVRHAAPRPPARREVRLASVSAPGAPDALLVTGHDRHTEDTGLVCVSGLPGASHVCTPK